MKKEYFDKMQSNTSIKLKLNSIKLNLLYYRITAFGSDLSVYER